MQKINHFTFIYHNFKIIARGLQGVRVLVLKQNGLELDQIKRIKIKNNS